MTTNTNDSHRDALDAELADLSVPMLSVPDMIMILCEADTEGNGYAAYFDAMQAEGSKTDLQLIANDLLDFALESVSQLPSIRRSLEIADEIEALEG